MFFLLPNTPLAPRNTTAASGGHGATRGGLFTHAAGSLDIGTTTSAHLGSFHRFKSWRVNDEPCAIRNPLADIAYRAPRRVPDEEVDYVR